uniref:Neuritin-like protein isoform X1 n=1 Tax=Geotrypetes seraphini TaxID=260995 RepID=A0A6P8QNP3_GEOSA|nr:neuritin-like protein isoform X1 [Geotrypetes seraphini]XP_033798639.1 neuritin-like protein isoform X1 [Geotrypetes seraphini]
MGALDHGCSRLLAFIVLLPLHLVYNPVTATSRCDMIYKGFAECLINFGDSLAQSVQQLQEEETEDVEELETICNSWDDFHSCANAMLANCPEEAAAIWESLRQESKKIQFRGNLHDLCSSRTRMSNSGKGSDTSETNKETLRGSAHLLHYGWLVLSMVLLLPFFI